MKIPKFHQLFLSVVDVCKFIYQLKLTNEILTRNLEKKLLSRFCWLSSEKNKQRYDHLLQIQIRKHSEK